MIAFNKPAPCCVIGCGKLAEWYIEYGETPDDYTLGCTAHIGELLTDAREHRLYRFPFEYADTTQEPINEHGTR